ncbi:MAG TPA: hypothetical protein P5512_01535 [Chitinophagales bacterium]|nr:hypothetical protein [Chitinophagales bacterium]HQU38435.1 hypothetical protein [Chitinophagales bacterium]HQU75996.1 hypothetical protein [Chitinophagales bacterium]HRX22795.1 hypothetical protein [Chitinophagales bacterium]
MTTPSPPLMIFLTDRVDEQKEISGTPHTGNLYLPAVPYGNFCRFEDWLSGSRKWRIDLGTD